MKGENFLQLLIEYIQLNDLSIIQGNIIASFNSGDRILNTSQVWHYEGFEHPNIREGKYLDNSVGTLKDRPLTIGYRN